MLIKVKVGAASYLCPDAVVLGWPPCLTGEAGKGNHAFPEPGGRGHPRGSARGVMGSGGTLGVCEGPALLRGGGVSVLPAVSPDVS